MERIKKLAEEYCKLDDDEVNIFWAEVDECRGRIYIDRGIKMGQE